MPNLKEHHKIGDPVYCNGSLGVIKATSEGVYGPQVVLPETERSYRIEWFNDDKPFAKGYIRKVWFSFYEISSFKEQLREALGGQTSSR